VKTEQEVYRKLHKIIVGASEFGFFHSETRAEIDQLCWVLDIPNGREYTSLFINDKNKYQDTKMEMGL